MMGNINQITAATVTFAALTVGDGESETGTITVPGARLQTDLVFSAKSPVTDDVEAGDLYPYFEWEVTADDTVTYKVSNPGTGDVTFDEQDINIVIGRFDHFIGDGL